MNKKAQTTATYNLSASAMAVKFNSLSARSGDIQQAMSVVVQKNPITLEIGCGNGRDACEILKHTSRYKGIDISEKMIELAREQAPVGEFEVADVETYTFSQGLDAVFAFASLIHAPRESLEKIYTRVFAALNEGGIFRVSMKYANTYQEYTKTDELGTRTYYFYSQEDLDAMAKDFTVVHCENLNVKGQDWIEYLLQKPIR